MQHLLTIDNLYDPSILRELELAASELVERLKTTNKPDDTVIVLSKGWSDDKKVMAYYLASMSKRAIFWLDKVEQTLVTDNSRVVVSKRHLGK